MRLICFATFLLLFSCKTQEAPEVSTGLIADTAMVVTARVEASEIGLSILAQGGNAFDAMVATELALAVAFPFAGNIGGGGFMVYRTHDGETGALDYREKAPLAAKPDMYLDENGAVISGKSTLGGMAIGIPGTIAGLFATHQKWGSLPIETLINPAIALAKKGVVVTQNQAQSLENARNLISETSGNHTLFSKTYKAGDTIKHLALATTLEAIKENGRDEFYKGKTAANMVTFLQENGSIITLEDLNNYEAVWRDPVAFHYKELKVISMAPPSSGGIGMGQIAKMMEPYDIKSYGHNSPEVIQLFVEAARRAYADRSHYLGDPDFVDIPVETLMDTAYLNSRMANFSFDRATASTQVSHGAMTQNTETAETTHYSIVDSFGNAVSVTTTLNGAYGSKLYSEKLGFFFNNEMDDFSSKPGSPNMFGLIGSQANSIQPGKRMLSSMTPTIVEKNGKLWMVVGTPGGSRIITTVLQTILNVYEFDMNMQQAADAPRFHHQWLPDEVTFESGFLQNTLDRLAQKGYTITNREALILGSIAAIRVLEDGKLEAGADQRKDNQGAGY